VFCDGDVDEIYSRDYYWIGGESWRGKYICLFQTWLFWSFVVVLKIGLFGADGDGRRDGSGRCGWNI
jgi:hypothetical protein